MIYCDLDGVLVSWIRGFKQLSPNKTFEEFKKEDKLCTAWKLIINAGEDWWANLDWQPDGKELWNYVKNNVTILSSPGTSNTNMISKGKARWIKRELGENVKYIIEREKHIYAKDNTTILIDDSENKIIPWRLAGGIGILHKSTKETIEELKKLGL